MFDPRLVRLFYALNLMGIYAGALCLLLGMLAFISWRDTTALGIGLSGGTWGALAYWLRSRHSL